MNDEWILEQPLTCFMDTITIICHYSIGHTNPAKVGLKVVCANTKTQFTKLRPTTVGGKEVSRHDWCESWEREPGSD